MGHHTERMDMARSICINGYPQSRMVINKVMKEVISLLGKHVYERNIDRLQGLNVLLDFLVDMFDYRHYQKEDGFANNIKEISEKEPYLFKIALIWLDKVATAMDNGSFLDFFGGIYEEMYQSKSKASQSGQFFTPPEVAELLAKLCQIGGERDYTCSDPAGCGSGRTLLAHYAANKFADCYYRADDLDIVSVKMCALNMMAHGMRGQVVQHDTLVNPILFDFGYEINEVRYPFPTPYLSLREIKYTKEDLERDNMRVLRRYGDNVLEKTTCHGREELKQIVPVEGAKPKPIFGNKEVKVNPPFESTQLNLFGDEW